jgi:two-component system, response regulator PdtaR
MPVVVASFDFLKSVCVINSDQNPNLRLAPLEHPLPSVLRAPADGKSGSALRPVRILVVEDDYFVAIELEHRLKEAGFEVVGIAGTADEALEMASQRPELAIMDIRLAGLRDGVDAAIELLARFGVPSIFATAHGDQDTRKRAEPAKPLGWLEKPYSPESLIALVNMTLKKGT